MTSKVQKLHAAVMDNTGPTSEKVIRSSSSKVVGLLTLPNELLINIMEFFLRPRLHWLPCDKPDPRWSPALSSLRLVCRRLAVVGEDVIISTDLKFHAVSGRFRKTRYRLIKQSLQGLRALARNQRLCRLIVELECMAHDFKRMLMFPTVYRKWYRRKYERYVDETDAKEKRLDQAYRWYRGYFVECQQMLDSRFHLECLQDSLGAFSNLERVRFTRSAEFEGLATDKRVLQMISVGNLGLPEDFIPCVEEPTYWKVFSQLCKPLQLHQNITTLTLHQVRRDLSMHTRKSADCFFAGLKQIKRLYINPVMDGLYEQDYEKDWAMVRPPRTEQFINFEQKLIQSQEEYKAWRTLFLNLNNITDIRYTHVGCGDCQELHCGRSDILAGMLRHQNFAYLAIFHLQLVNFREIDMKKFLRKHRATLCDIRLDRSCSLQLLSIDAYDKPKLGNWMPLLNIMRGFPNLQVACIIVDMIEKEQQFCGDLKTLSDLARKFNLNYFDYYSRPYVQWKDAPFVDFGPYVMAGRPQTS